MASSNTLPIIEKLCTVKSRVRDGAIRCYKRIRDYLFPFRRRKKFLRKCQAFIDDVHDGMSKHQFFSPEVIIQEYGKDFFRAFEHQVHALGVNLNLDSRNNAIEWMYHSQHFKFMALEERRVRKAERRSWMSFIISIIALLTSSWPLIKKILT